MRKKKAFYVYLFLFFYVNISVSYGQSECKSNIIRTNPEGNTCNQLYDTTAYNIEKPNKKNCNGIILNWQDEFFNLSSNELLPNPDGLIKSPFFQNDDANLVDLATSKDFYSIDGWELIKRDFGYTDSGTIGEVGHPYFILYNKYLGLMRVFIAVKRLNDYNTMKIVLSEIPSFTLSNNIYRPMLASPLISLSTFPGLQNNLSVVNFYNENERWFYSDFIIHYDPCICFYKYLTLIEVHLVSQANITLEGIEEGTITQVVNNLGTANNTNKINSFSDVITVGSQAVESYKTTKEAIDDAKATIDKYIDAEKKDPDKVEEKKERDALQKFVNFMVGPNSIAREISDIAPIVAAGFSIYDFFNTTPKEDPGMKIIIPPLTQRSNISLSGSISNAFLYKQILFWNPGSDNLNEDEGYYPYYNQPLGTFNLLREPVINRYKEKYIESYGETFYFDTLYRYRDISGYKLYSNLEYVINPAAGLSLNPNEIEILAALVFDVYDGYIDDSLIDDFIVSDDANTYRTQYVPYECLGNAFATLHSELYELSVPYLGSFPSDDYILPNNVYLKLIVSMKKTTSDNKVIFVGKFPVKINDVEGSPLSLANENDIYLNHSNFLILNNTLLDEDIRVWDYVELGPEIDFMGCNFITAGNYINVKPGTDLEPNISLKISQPVDCNEEKYGPVSSSDIYLFCHSEAVDGYKPEQRKNYKGAEPNDTSASSWKFKDEIYQVKPNPARDEIFIGFTLSAKSSGKIILVDILGNVVKEFYNEDQMSLGYNSRLLDLKDIPPGVYMCVIATQYARINTKIVKI